MANTDMANMIDMAKGLQQSASQASSDSSAFLKFTKFGSWVWGSEETEVEEESLWVIHPQAFQHGWIAWGDKAHNNQGQKLGEILVSAVEPLPLESSLNAVEGTWAKQVSMQLMCVEGLDKDVRVNYNANSAGGRSVYKDILNAVVEKITSGNPEVVPVVSLSSGSYTHKEYGKIFTPAMEIVEYKTLEALNSMLDNLGLEDKSSEVEETKAEETKAEETKAEVTTETDTPTRARRTRRARS